MPISRLLFSILAFSSLVGASCAQESAKPKPAGGTSSNPESAPIVTQAVAATTAVKSDWPQFRGIDRDAISQETGLLKTWPKEGPKLLWTYEQAGMGYSGPAVVGNRLYTLGTDGSDAIVFALDAKTGKKLWVHNFGEDFENGWGDGPRSTPTVDGEFLYVLTGRGTLACVNATDGKPVWSKSLTKDFGGKLPNWGFCESPLIDGDRVVVTPGGKNCIVALDKKTGEKIWSSTGLDDAAHYASIITGTVGDVPMYITMTNKGVVGISAKDGKFLWRFEDTGNKTATIPTPIFHEGFVYSTSGYGAGCGLVKLVASGSTVEAEKVYANKNMKNHHGGVLLHEDHVYGYSDGVGWVCQDFKTGEIVWRERSKLDKGSIAYADGQLYCYGEVDGTVVLIEASTEGWKESGRFTIPKTTSFDRKRGRIWTHPVIADGKLFLRDQELFFCYDIQAK